MGGGFPFVPVLFAEHRVAGRCFLYKLKSRIRNLFILSLIGLRSLAHIGKNKLSKLHKLC